MVKRQRVRERLKKKLKSPTNEKMGKDSREGKGLSGGLPTRLQKKMSKRIAFVESLRENKLRQLKTAGVEKRKKGSKDGVFSNLNSLADGLEDLLTKQNNQSKGPTAPTSKNREKLMVQESARLQQVLTDSRFQSDPFSAIYNHLQATLPEPEQKTEVSKKRSK